MGSIATICYGPTVTDDRYQRAAAASRKARGLRDLTDDEAARVRRLWSTAEQAEQAYRDAIEARDLELRRLRADGVGPTDLARASAPESGNEKARQVNIARILRHATRTT